MIFIQGGHSFSFGKWNAKVFNNGGYLIYHYCKKKKHIKKAHKVVWGSEFHKKFKKVEKPMCVRCREEIPAGVIFAAKSGTKV